MRSVRVVTTWGELIMPQNYVPIFIFAFVAFLVAGGTVALCTLIRPKNPSATKRCPMSAHHSLRQTPAGATRARFYIVAILFVVFDVETVFLFPWAVQFSC